MNTGDNLSLADHTIGLRALAHKGELRTTNYELRQLQLQLKVAMIFASGVRLVA